MPFELYPSGGLPSAVAASRWWKRECHYPP